MAIVCSGLSKASAGPLGPVVIAEHSNLRLSTRTWEQTNFSFLDGSRKKDKEEEVAAKNDISK